MCRSASGRAEQLTCQARQAGKQQRLLERVLRPEADAERGHNSSKVRGRHDQAAARRERHGGGIAWEAANLEQMLCITTEACQCP